MFASVHFDNCWVLKGHCHNQFLEIEYNEQIPTDNLKYPVKDLAKPENIQFDFDDLQWNGIELLPQFNELNENAVINEFKLIDRGWRPFKGELPQTTETLIWNLKKFADYGDGQSQEWFADVQEKTDKINYWVNASKYIGFKPGNKRRLSKAIYILPLQGKTFFIYSFATDIWPLTGPLRRSLGPFCWHLNIDCFPLAARFEHVE